ncbi:MAG: MFS transporter [Lachnospiraceae bacterium]|nr:MFS transporter [Lachnospiraceae bacterium]
MKKPHYAWVICAACALLLFCIWGICATVFPVFNPYLMKVGNLTNTQVSMIPTIRMLFVCVGLSACHHIHMKIGLRLSGFLSLVGCTAGLLIFAFSASAPVYYAAAALIGFCYSLGSMMLVSLLLPRWFHSHMAFALGICSSSSGLATVIFPPILTPVMNRYSLRAGLLICAGVVALCAVLVLLMIRDHPRDLKMTAFSDIENDKKNARIHKSEGVHTKRAILLAVIAYGFFAGLALAGCSQISMLYTAAGYTSEEVALIMSLYGGVLTIAKILYGRLEDIFGNRYIGIGAFVIEIIGSVFMCLCRIHVLGFTGAVLFALGLPISTIGIPLFAEDLCPAGEYERATQTLNMTMFICGLIMSPLSGILADITGSYVPSYTIFTVFTAISFILICIAYFTRPRKAAA